MEKEQLKNSIIDVIENALLGSVATVDGNRPRVRYMIVKHAGDLQLYAATYAPTRKVKQIKENNNVEIIMGGNAQNWEMPYVTVEATAEIKTDRETKYKRWEDQMSTYFSGPDDPNYVVIEFNPRVIEYMAPGAVSPEVYKV
jgi:general stress protein 26